MLTFFCVIASRLALAVRSDPMCDVLTRSKFTPMQQESAETAYASLAGAAVCSGERARCNVA